MAAIARQRRLDQTTNVEKENQMHTTLQGLDGCCPKRRSL